VAAIVPIALFQDRTLNHERVGPIAGGLGVDDGKDQGASVPRGDELLRLVLESATDYAIFTVDPNGIVTSWNPGAEHLLGWRD